MEQVGWTPIDGMDHCWIKKEKNKTLGLCAVYVDDFCMIGLEQGAKSLLEELGERLRINIQERDNKVRFVGNDITITERGAWQEQ